ncbi:unnamed protein product (macronuclear) [Paramecium tetraurelia]|uniref:Uncharacterized protein n=1 Tax=Paramecium tetraurelia TaxID=5888 RepID=A0BNW4_PARTE|nr:uncharacterized protein GSPATT00030870001 [Paramecium tetraurelia]CAK60231.1 unnamed protein product [Paramecium tetraurelia]|eukprot:XP_001427629.1 hypothetical protein (macronuclear) [Paramecium tetraurelia strain d4-2]
MQHLSIYTFTNIVKFLQVEEIYSKLTLSNSLMQIAIHLIISIYLYNPYVQKVILSNYFPIEIIEQIQPQNYSQCIKSLKGGQLKEIPFWGIETNGGLANNSLRFWIGKTFMKTSEPQVGLRKFENAFISGTLSFNQVQFKKALLEYAQKFIEVMGQEITNHFFPDWYDINNNLIEISQIKIFDIFRSFSIFQFYENAQDWKCVQYLRDYAYQKHEQIDNMLEVDPYHLKDEEYEIIPSAIALVKEIEINRGTQLTQTARSLLIFTSTEQCIPNHPNEIYQCQTQEKLYQFILNHPQFTPSQTNIKLLLNIDPNIVYEDNHQLNYLYCTFEPKNDKQPLIWVEFVNENVDGIYLKLDKKTQRLAKSIQVRVLDVCFQEDPQFLGFGLAYVSVKGLTLNQQDWTVIQNLPD